MALHDFPHCTIVQDISVADIEPYFVICLSRDFTTKIGDQIAKDWSYILFRTRYGAWSSLRVEPLPLQHIETYTPSPINMNCTTREEDEGNTFHEPTTCLAKVLDFILDEWATTSQLDPMLEDLEIGLGPYCIFEKDIPIPSLMKT